MPPWMCDCIVMIDRFCSLFNRRLWPYTLKHSPIISTSINMITPLAGTTAITTIPILMAVLTVVDYW